MVGVSKCEVSTRVVSLGRRLVLASLAVLSLVVALTISAGVATAQYCTCDQCDECNLRQCSQRCCHEFPELWLINTRCAPRCKNLDHGFNCLSYKRYDRKCSRWVRESAESFLAQESSKPTLFYSHGNSLNHKNAMKSCWLIYCKMRCCPGPKRLVFWSWPAERVYKTKGFRVREMIEKNLRIKYIYAEYQGYYMAKLVNQMSLSQRVMMSGHSYGAITAAAAMHYIGGGCLRGLTLAGGEPVARPNLRAGIISGAFDNDMLIPGHRYGQAFIAGEKIFVTRNIHDSTLKKWPETSWTGRRAIGVTGVNANCLGEHYNKLCQQTMYPDVGKSHYLKPHLKSARFVSALCCLSFPNCQNCTSVVDGEQPAGELASGDQSEAEVDCSVLPDGFDLDQLTSEPGLVVRPVTEPDAPGTVLDNTPGSLLWEQTSEASLDLDAIDLADVFAAAGDARETADKERQTADLESTDDANYHQYRSDYADMIAEAQLPLLGAITNIGVPTTPQTTASFQGGTLRRRLPQLTSSGFRAPPIETLQGAAMRPLRLPSTSSEYSPTRHRQSDDRLTQPGPAWHRSVGGNRAEAAPIPPIPTHAVPPMAASAGQGNLLVRCVLCLAFVLTGKLYIFLGQRLFPS